MQQVCDQITRVGLLKVGVGCARRLSLRREVCGKSAAGMIESFLHCHWHRVSPPLTAGARVKLNASSIEN
jgi:hypothetical protein